ncbi:hypothetical protein NDU88_005191 [Pleurodeles waltl]|uniref:Uncharacterized protein n=1 Tax=Pleurodeles waltl TaxID=8319 RepID=A0AAV7PMY5_PLEWA|nr:hypothetical protein NDU88_005191 [Pleurodeles waltl]
MRGRADSWRGGLLTAHSLGTHRMDGEKSGPAGHKCPWRNKHTAQVIVAIRDPRCPSVTGITLGGSVRTSQGATWPGSQNSTNIKAQRGAGREKPAAR